MTLFHKTPHTYNQPTNKEKIMPAKTAKQDNPETAATEITAGDAVSYDGRSAYKVLAVIAPVRRDKKQPAHLKLLCPDGVTRHHNVPAEAVTKD